MFHIALSIIIVLLAGFISIAMLQPRWWPRIPRVLRVGFVAGLIYTAAASLMVDAFGRSLRSMFALIFFLHPAMALPGMPCIMRGFDGPCPYVISPYLPYVLVNAVLFGCVCAVISLGYKPKKTGMKK